MIPKRQHWIPKFYLEYFAAAHSSGGEPQAWVFSKQDDGLDVTLVGIKNICNQRYLYSPARPGEPRVGEMEARLSSLEHVTSKIWPSIASDFVDLSDISIRKSLALFMATLFLRHPRNIELVERIHRQIVSAIESDRGAEPEKKKSPINQIGGNSFQFDQEKWAEFRDRDSIGHHIDFVSLLRHDSVPIAELLMKKRWSVVVSNEPAFITADNCVVAHHGSLDTFGLRTPGTLVTFPLSPTRILMLDDRFNEPANQYYPLAKDGPAPVNFTIFRGASDLMISSRHPDLVLREIVEMGDSYGGLPDCEN